MLESLDALIGFCSIVLALSLLVTTLVQLAQNLLNMRGHNLAWSLARMFEQMPLPNNLRCDAREALQVAEGLLRLPGITVDEKNLGKAIDPELIPLLLEDLAKRSSGDLAKKARAIRKLILEEQAAAMKNEAAIEESRGVTGEASSSLKVLQAEIDKKEDEAIRFVRQRKDRSMARFDHFMTAARERFSRRTQKWSLGLSLLLCVVFRVDVFTIMNEFQENPNLATGLVESGIEKAGILAPQESRRRTNEGLWESILASWIGGHALSSHAGPDPAAAANMQREDWLAFVHQVESEQLIPAGDLVTVFEAVYGQRLVDEHEFFTAQLSDIYSSIENAQVPVFRPRRGLHAWLDFDGILRWLLSGILVALGAPFWFNVLRQLTNLRPVLAQALDPKAKDAAKPKNPPGPASAP